MSDQVSVQHQRHGASIGQPLSRREGLLKVTGRATFAADNRPAGLLHAVMAVSGISRGHVTHLDVEAALAHPGVVAVMTPANAPKLAKSPDERDTPFSFRLDCLQSDAVRYANQPIAVVIAETLEAASEGVVLLKPRYSDEPVRVGLDGNAAFAPPAVGAGNPAKGGVGDMAAGLARASKRVEATYQTAAQYHNAMEPHAIVADWNGDKLVIHTPSQGMAMAQGRLASLFGIKPADILIKSPFLGGGFGSKGLIAGPQVLGIMAARFVGRPVKLVLRREQMFGPVGHRGETRQTLQVAADDSGALTALGHHTLTTTSSFDDFFEPASSVSLHLYASPAIATGHEGVRADIGTPIFMRAPGEATGSVALEGALDELAEQCGMDPLAFRLRNYAEVDPADGRPFSSKALRACYQQGADRFGWLMRPLHPRRMRDDEGHLVGWGMGTATFPALMFQAEAHAILKADGSARVEIGAHDMGQGAWTGLAQIAADGLGVAYDRLDLEIGSSHLPDGGLAGGSAGTATAGSAIYNAALDIARQLAALAAADQDSPLFGAGNRDFTLRDGHLVMQDDESRREAVQTILARASKSQIEGSGKGAADPQKQQSYSMHSHGAVFAEVKVDPDLGQVRVTRLVGAFAAGRIINPRMVESQYRGGMIWGVSFALHEHAAHDPRSGRVMNANLADYHVPVNADVMAIETLMVEEHDPHVNPLGIKGVGEIGITGTAGAIVNAVWHATGARIRDIPITLDKLLQ